MPVDVLDPEPFAFALSYIDDGFVFEDFSQQFLSQVIGYEFEPIGGVHDRGIDALRNMFSRKGFSRWLYQSSIEMDPRSKIRGTGEALRGNKIRYDQLTYITNQVVDEKDRREDEYYETFKKPLRIFDRKWFAANVNHSVGTQNAFRVFVTHNLHEYNNPGTAYAVSDLVHDPRLFVFLRQQWETSRTDNLSELLTDTLILFALEGTDPDQGKLKSRDEIIADMTMRVKFEPKSIIVLVDSRLRALSTKPRRIRHHQQEDAYCLPFETRLEIQERNLQDAALYEAFKEQSEARLTKYLDKTRVKDGLSLMEGVLHTLFYQQGLEFAGFVLSGENRDAVEKNLADIIASVVDDSSVVPKNRDAVKNTLHIAIRDMVYNGSPEQKQFLGRLCNTYMMLFLLRVDPKITAYFSEMASKLRVYVDNSIIIPALSEIFLADENRRHWNLLKRARAAGVQLLVEERIVDELVHHFRMIRNIYEDQYKPAEATYLQDEIMTLYIDEIMIRAYYYSRQRGQVATFDNFLDSFVDPNIGSAAADQLITWLKEEFGIQFVTAPEFKEHVKAEDVEILYQKLRGHKSHDEKARTDAHLALTVYHDRLINNERAEVGMLGYRTWWLSKDTVTHMSVAEVFGDRFETSCYIRPDFLHNYISLAPSQQEVKDTYRALLPSLVGVNISYHISPEIIAVVQKLIKEHGERKSARVVSVLRELADRLKSDPSFRNKSQVKHFLDEQLQQATTVDSHEASGSTVGRDLH